ncbi:hypothetical protein K493DRAFT_348822 [Basidiobolus meristosporus CBS 931.73]|uniref:Uncharacterized protein n=1 Tax=Basidiobolus meristosporus CBS 931.73 TaxID=1314790 RepID=A0A1Y1YMH6_9FUNG|nr:hypothetical protein K493DRAFT_348822 [Basidiobolus meristosporus CBS 931.73]|eukprot:ORX99053.1 hypothetical protein K493DRAFT_348822 [Basidiobolus meristosporus CBS 931.73]
MSSFNSPPSSASDTSPLSGRLLKRKASMEPTDSSQLKQQLERLLEYSSHLETLMTTQQESFQTQLSKAQMETEFLRRELRSTKEYYRTTNQDIRLKTCVEQSLRSQEILLLNQKLEESYGTVDRLKKRVLKYKHRKQKEKRLAKKSPEEPKPTPQSKPYSFIHFEHENPGLPKQTRVECSPSQNVNPVGEKPAQLSSPSRATPEKSPTSTSGNSTNSSFRPLLQPVVTDHQIKVNKTAPYLISTFSCPDIQAKVRSPYLKWTPEEDTLLRKAVGHYGCTNWQQISKEVPGRSYHQCRQRWLKVLKNSINQESYKIDSSQVHMTLNSPLSLTSPNTQHPLGNINHGAFTMSHSPSTRSSAAEPIPTPRKDSCPLWRILDN